MEFLLHIAVIIILAGYTGFGLLLLDTLKKNERYTNGLMILYASAWPGVAFVLGLKVWISISAEATRKIGERL